MSSWPPEPIASPAAAASCAKTAACLRWCVMGFNWKRKPEPGFCKTRVSAPSALRGNSSLVEDAASENRPAPQGGVEPIERQRGHQQNPGQADARIPSGPLSRQGIVLQGVVDHQIGHQRQQAEVDHHKHGETTKNQSAHQTYGVKLTTPSEEKRK